MSAYPNAPPRTAHVVSEGDYLRAVLGAEQSGLGWSRHLWSVLARDDEKVAFFCQGYDLAGCQALEVEGAEEAGEEVEAYEAAGDVPGVSPKRCITHYVTPAMNSRGPARRLVRPYLKKPLGYPAGPGKGQP